VIKIFGKPLQALGNFIENWMVKNERKLILSDVYGNVIMHRYCLFRKEEVHQSIVNASKWPALYVHRFLLEESPDGPSQHSHVGSSISIILLGGYVERVGDKVKERKPGSMMMLKYRDTHKIIKTKPDTWTLFGRWITRSQDVRVVPSECTEICDYCKEKTDGVCFNRGKEFSYSTYSKQFENSKEATFRFPAWFHAGAETDKYLSRRRSAVLRLGRRSPVGEQEQLKIAQEYKKIPLMLVPSGEKEL